MAGTLWDIEKVLFSQLPPTSSAISPHLLPEAHAAPQKKPSKWDNPEAASYKVDIRTVGSHADIGTINWTNLQDFKGVERSEKGTEGLFFVETTSGAFIVKRSSNIAAEVFCSLLGMKLNLHTPKVRIVSSNSEEGNNLLACLQTIDKSFRVYTTLANQSNILLMEFVRGITLNKVNSKTGPEVLQTTTLQQLGSLMAFDVIINNSDRLPIAWTNEGNMDNIMLSEKGCTVVPIDNKIIPLDANHAYGDRVRDLLRTVLSHPDHESSQFRKIRDLVTLYTGYDVGKEGSILMQEGFISTVKQCAAMDLGGLEKELISWQAALQSHHNLSINTQSIEFILRIIRIFQESIELARTSPSTAPASIPSSSTSVPPSHPTHDQSLANIDECAWIKVAVPTEKPAPRRYHSAVLYEKRLYIFGGVCVKPASNDFYVFDFDTRKWAIVVAHGTPPSPRCGHSATVYNNKMWIFGGHDNNRNPFNDLFVFDFITSTWEKHQISEGELWPSPRYHHSATLIGSSLYVIGGSSAKSKYYIDAFVLSLDTRKWELLNVTGDIPDPRAGHLAVEWQGNILLFGGYGGDGGYTYHVDTYAFEIATNTFRELDPSGTFPRTARPLSYAPYYFGKDEGAIYLFGGFDGKNPMSSLHLWNLKTNKWKIVKAWMAMDESSAGGSLAAAAAGKMDPIPRYGHSTVLEGGTLTIFGGSGSMMLDDIVQFDLQE